VNSARALPAILRALRETAPPPGGVLSAFVDTTPQRSIGQASLIGFRERARAVRAELPRGQRVRFDAAVAQAQEVLEREFSPGHPGVAIYASGDEAYVFAVPLPTRPPEAVRFGERPVLSPLEAAIDDEERAAVLLFDKERARLFTIVLGEIEARHSLFDEVPGKQKTGDWFALSQKRYERHHEDHVLRHAKRAIAALLEELAQHPFDRLLLAGPEEAIALLQDHLPRRLSTRMAGTLSLELFAGDAEVLATARPALAEIERRQEAAELRRLINDAGSARVTIGPDATLPALSDGRVHQLFVLDGNLGPARECPGCGRLTRDEDPCSRCGTATRTVADLRERAVVAALDSGARIELIAPETTAGVALRGGIAARTRWA
jgi:peptide subunit release factor 1 (eRF1)